MVPRIRYVAVLLVLLLCVTGASAWAQSKPPAQGPAADAAPAVAAAPAAEPAPVIDQRALDLLKKMSDTLSQAKSVSFQARSMVPVRTPDGLWVNLYGTSQVLVQGPDKLFARTAGDFAPYDFYFDGKTITAYSPAKNLYAVKAAPATIDGMIDQAYREEGRSFPYADILVSEPYAVLTKGLTGARYVGQSEIRPLVGPGGIKTDHLVFSNKGVQWQIWIDANDHLPRLVCATYLSDASEPSYTVEFGDWKLNEPVMADVFVFKNTTNAGQVEFKSPVAAEPEKP